VVKTSGPLHSVRASGTIGDAITFANWKGRSYVRKRSKPTNPKTAPQIAARAGMRFLNNEWNTLDAADKASWQTRAARSNVAPYNSFLSVNLAVLRKNEPPYTAEPPAATTTAGDAPEIDATAGENQITLAIAAGTAAPDWGWAVYRALSSDEEPTIIADPATTSKACPYDSAYCGTGDLGPSSSTRWFLMDGHDYRIRQNGTITQVRAAIVAAITGYVLEIWRLNGTTFDWIGESENISASLVVGQVVTVTLANPIASVLEGDFYCVRLTATTTPLSAHAGKTGRYIRYVTTTPPNHANYDWRSKTTVNNYGLPVDLFMQQTKVLFIGDSIFSGGPAHASFCNAADTTDINSTIEWAYAQLSDNTTQNMGYGSDTSAAVKTRFTADVIAIHPAWCVINAGVNDIAQGGVQKGTLPNPAAGTYLANLKYCLDACAAAGVRPLVLKILPWTAGTNAQMQTRDLWNADLAILASWYANAVVIDASELVGQFRAGGDAGNLWDIIPAYTPDGVHFNATGHAKIAEAIHQAIVAAPTPTHLLAMIQTAETSYVDTPETPGQYLYTVRGFNQDGVWGYPSESATATIV
jgi:lysophospholipase L1-like esterase